MAVSIYFFGINTLWELKIILWQCQPQAEQASLERSLEIAKSSLGTPKPKTPKWTAYRRSKLRDEKLSEDIDDLTRRRRIVSSLPFYSNFESPLMFVNECVQWPDGIPPENEKIIKAVLRTPGVISTLPAAEVSQKDIVKLLPGEWLNDEVINFYGVMVNLRSTAAKTRRDKGFPEPGDENLLDAHVFSSFFFEKLSKQGYSSVRRWTKKVRRYP